MNITGFANEEFHAPRQPKGLRICNGMLTQHTEDMIEQIKLAIEPLTKVLCDQKHTIYRVLPGTVNLKT